MKTLATYQIGLYLDVRSNTRDGFPVKLNVYSTEEKKKKLYRTQIYIEGKGRNPAEDAKRKLEKAQTITQKVRNEADLTIIQLHDKLQSITTKAETIAKNLDPFTFEQFERSR